MTNLNAWTTFFPEHFRPDGDPSGNGEPYTPRHTHQPMKTHMHARTALAVFAAAAGLAATASGQTTTWYYGASNNSANFGVTPTTSQAITWQDGWASADTLANNNFFGSQSLQVNRPDTFGADQSILMFGFGGTGLSAANVSAATLYLREDFSFFNGTTSSGTNTWNIVGIAAGNSGWDTNTMTWSDINGASAGDWTGGTLGGSLSGSYGSFAVAATSADANVSIDLTLAFKAYLNGTISGIAFVNSTNGDTFSGNDYSFVPFSNDNTTATNRPGLLVTTVPEPASASFGLLGAVGLLIRRRR